MPEQLPKALADAVEKLLREGLSAAAVSRQLAGKAARLGLKLTPARIRMEGYSLGIEPHKGGRPPGSTDKAPRKQWSPNRRRVIELRAQGLSLKAIEAESGITKSAAGQLLDGMTPEQATKALAELLDEESRKIQ